MGRKDKKIIKKHLSLSGNSLIELINTIHEKNSEFRFKATGNSMKPTILSGDIISISPKGEYLPGPGEIAAYKYHDDQELIVHRIIRITYAGYSIRGDNANYTHHKVPLENIIGIVTKVERAGKTIFRPGRYYSSFFTKALLRTRLLKIKIIRFTKKIINKI